MIFAATSIFIFGSTCFLDIIITTRHGINFWNALFEGEIFRFYTYNLNVAFLPGYGFKCSAMYNIVEYVIFAVYDFPLWVFESLTGIDSLGTVIGILYAKSIVILFIIGVLKQVCLIAEEIFGDKIRNDLLALLICTSILSITTIYAMGQYDIILTYFMLGGIHGALIDNRKKFLLNFTVAIPLKLFALLAFIPILLLKEKKILQIISNSCIVMCLYVITTLLYMKMDFVGVNTANKDQIGLIGRIFANNMQLSLEPVSIFLLTVIGIFLLCYFYKPPADLYKIIIVWICCILFSAVCIALPLHPQWSILVMPFMTLLIVHDESKKGMLIILETVATMCLGLSLSIYYYNTVATFMVDILWMGRVFGRINNRNSIVSVFNIMDNY